MATRVPDETIIKLNDFGLSLKRMGELTGCHFTTIKQRLDKLGLECTDTRRAFMDDIYDKLTPQQLEWLANELNLGQPISAFIRMLIVKEFNNRKKP